MNLFKYRLFEKLLPNPLDRMLVRLKKRGGNRILIEWNRGLGDIALGLYAIIERIRTHIPDAAITFLTRENLREGFQLIRGVHTLTVPWWRRGQPYSMEETLQRLGIDKGQFDLLIEKPDPTRWVRWQLGKLIPHLHWPSQHEELWRQFPQLNPHERYIGFHVQTETDYAHWRNWPIGHWRHLMERLTRHYQVKVLLFGFHKTPDFEIKNVVDLRGDTSLFQLLSIIKNCCKALVVPDSGISSMTYFLAENFPITIISLWAETDMGILKQNVSSPNRELKHIPILAKDRNLQSISVEEVERAISTCL